MRNTPRPSSGGPATTSRTSRSLIDSEPERGMDGRNGERRVTEPGFKPPPENEPRDPLVRLRNQLFAFLRGHSSRLLAGGPSRFGSGAKSRGRQTALVAGAAGLVLL